MDTREEQTLNPWISMWVEPRETIQQIISSNPTRMVLLLAALSGFGSALDKASIKSMGDMFELPIIFSIAAIAGPIGGILSLYLGGALVRWTGTWIGGVASSQNIRAALAWSSVPLIWALLIWIPELALIGDELFTSETPRMDASYTLLLAFLGLSLIELVIAIWTLVILLKSLGQVQGFSAWRALGNLLLSVLVIVVPILIIAVGFTAIS
jgi:hypothetical protein